MDSCFSIASTAYLNFKVSSHTQTLLHISRVKSHTAASGVRRRLQRVHTMVEMCTKMLVDWTSMCIYVQCFFYRSTGQRSFIAQKASIKGDIPRTAVVFRSAMKDALFI